MEGSCINNCCDNFIKKLLDEYKQNIGDIRPVNLNDKKIVILNRQNENSFIFSDGLFRFAHQSAFFHDNLSAPLRDILQDMIPSTDFKKFVAIVQNKLSHLINQELSGNFPMSFSLEQHFAEQEVEYKTVAC
jgi:hypothetical protein